MLRTNKSVSVTGQSYIETDGEDGHTEKVVAYMNASIPENGDININKSIQDKALFSANKKDVLKDFSEFENYVYNLA